MTTAGIERSYISQFYPELLGLVVHSQGVPTDADDEVVVSMVNDETQGVMFSRAANNVATGTYEIQLNSGETSVPGYYTVTWEYDIDGRHDLYETYVQIGRANPAYDSLPPEYKNLVDRVTIRFMDLFDAPEGGPNLQVYLETKFNRGRIAQMMNVGLGKLNTMAQPYSSYDMTTFPLTQWGPLLEQITYIEVIKHLRRSYVEQPQFMGGEVTRLDRRDYLQRWGEILQDEEEALKGQLDVFKMAAMHLGTPRVLVGGGVYGRFAPTRAAGSIAARPRYWSRFY
jgi:hypothetical protein